MHTWNAREYSENSSAQWAWALELIDKLDLRGNERVLDVGCGDGKITVEMAKRLPSGIVVGVDASPDMIQFANQRFPAEDYPNVSFVMGDARSLLFYQEFDIVFSNAALHWILDQRPVLQGMYRALRTGGRMLLQMGGKGNAGGIAEAAMAIVQDERYSCYFEGFTFPYGFFDPEDYREWLVQARFTPLRVQLIHKDMSQSGKPGLLAWMRTTWMPFTDRLPPDMRGAFLEEIADRYIGQRPLDADNLVHADMCRLEVEALKQ